MSAFERSCRPACNSARVVVRDRCRGMPVEVLAVQGYVRGGNSKESIHDFLLDNTIPLDAVLKLHDNIIPGRESAFPLWHLRFHGWTTTVLLASAVCGCCLYSASARRATN
ncbi:hypothetical protein CBM2599_A10280 [Cupriavidus taiwanensis]|nr:hypothetical protein CBM2599_A10280 [Cupriavidus taiwanensis]SOY80466.1 hypothetical protein CBM2600_A10123 [Cupriavidus taiwanensis]